MIELKLFKSYQLVEEIFEHYNNGKRLSAQLRGRHFEGIKALLRLLKKEMAKYQFVGLKSVEGRLLRPLKTNRKQLAKWLRCCEKSVYNYLERLQAAGCIRKIWHGSNASFDIEVNTDLLWLHDPALSASENVAVVLQNPLPHMRQSLPHTLSPSVTCQVTNEYNELGMAAPEAAPAAPGADPSVANHQQPGTEPGYPPGSTTRSAVDASLSPSKKVPRKKVPPRKAPLTLEAALDHVPEHLHGRIRARIDEVWNYAQEHFAEWYPGFIVPAEAERGRAALAEFFVYSAPGAWNAAAKQFVKRIDMVDRHLSVRKEAGKKAWLPIPSLYFDHRNKTGFAGTKDWYKTYLQQVQVATEEKAISRCLSLHWRAVKSGNPDEIADVTTRIKQYLEKKGGAKLYARFTGKIFTQPTINAAAQS